MHGYFFCCLSQNKTPGLLDKKAGHQIVLQNALKFTYYQRYDAFLIRWTTKTIPRIAKGRKKTNPRIVPTRPKTPQIIPNTSSKTPPTIPKINSNKPEIIEKIKLNITATSFAIEK